jgi:glycosyltransferase involved in cell wall biosynthesis
MGLKGRKFVPFGNSDERPLAIEPHYTLMASGPQNRGVSQDLSNTTVSPSLDGTDNFVQSPSHKPDVFISVIICTYGRANSLFDLLNTLKNQTYRHLEILVVDGNDEPSPAFETVEKFLDVPGNHARVTLIRSKKGLTRQRNVGLQAAKGDLICFLDDDVTFERDFFSEVVQLFDGANMQDVGGITPYDLLHYPMAISLRWHLRWLFGVMPGRDPGAADYLGRAVPIAFLKPWTGNKEIGWLPGFCMVYRRAATEGLLFDEELPTYGGEDRDFSMRVGQRHRLLICGHLHVKHHYSVEGRDDDLDRLRQSSFGSGRRFAKYRRGFGDYFTMAHVVLGDLLIDLIALAHRPVRNNVLTLIVRIRAFCAGLKSVRAADASGTSSLSQGLIGPRQGLHSSSE